MRKILLFVFVVLVFTSFQISTWSNKDKYFFKTDYITKVDGKYEFEIKKLFVEKPPKFYEPDLYMEKGELTLQEEFLEGNMRGSVCFPVIYGWQVANFENLSYKNTETLVADKSKPYNSNVSMRTFDINNGLVYEIFDDGTLRCRKITKDKDEESWRVKLPFTKVYSYRKATGKYLVIAGLEQFMAIDTVDVKIVADYKVNEGKPLNIALPKDNKLWIVTFYENLLGKTRENYREGFSIFVVDFLQDKILSFFPDKPFVDINIQDDGVVIKDDEGFYAIDDALNTFETKLADISKDAKMKKLGLGYGKARNRFVYTIGDKLYFFDKNKPLVPREIPNNLEITNYMPFDGFQVGYVLQENGYCYGYDIANCEKTWKLKTDELPKFSSESGVIIAKPDRLLVYGIDKNKPAK